MKICNKCGAQLEDKMKLCNKCGALAIPIPEKDVQTKVPEESFKADFKAETSYAEPEDVNDTVQVADADFEYGEDAHTPKESLQSDNTQPLREDTNKKTANPMSVSTVDIKSRLHELVENYIPDSLLSKNPGFMSRVGLVCAMLVAAVYLVCMYVFIPDICWPIGKSAELGSGGAGAVWLFIYFLINFTPLVFSLWPLKIKEFKKYSLICAAGTIILTFVSLICWALCEPGSVHEAMVIYPLQNSFNTQAWFSLMDCLSEAWYLKIIFSLGAIFGYGVDFLVNENK